MDVTVELVIVAVVSVLLVVELAVTVVEHALQCAGHISRIETPNTMPSQEFTGGPYLSQSG